MDLQTTDVDTAMDESESKSDEAESYTHAEDSMSVNGASGISTADSCPTEASSKSADTESKAALNATKTTRGGRGYQENRRGKKPLGDKTYQLGTDSSSNKTGSRKVVDNSSCEAKASGGSASQSVASTEGASVEPERRAKGDVHVTTVKKGDGFGIVSRKRQDSDHKPSGDGDVSNPTNLPISQNNGRDDLLNLLKQPPKEKKAGLSDRDRGIPSRELKDKGKSALELEEQWRREAEQSRNKEDELKRQEEEERLREEENLRKEEERKRLEEEEQQRIKEEELRCLDEFIKEAKERIDFKAVLREQNLKAAENRPDESFFFKLDSNLKKNTAFVKKLKTLTESQKDSLVKDLNSLNLTKYVGEVAAAVVEAKLKMSDINCALTICSLMYQRYADFASSLMENWHKVLMTKKDDKVPNPSKLRVDLRLFADLVAVGVFTEKEGLPILANQLTLLTVNDKDEHNNLTIIISFCKHCGDDYAGLMPRKLRLLAETHGHEIPRSQFLASERQKACRNLLRDYNNSLCKHLVQDCKEVRNMEKQNRRVLQTKGELSAERKEKYEAAQLSFQKLLQNATMMADLLDEDLPHLPEEELKPDPESGGLDIFSPTKGLDFQMDGTDSGVFEDEDTRQFYETLPDLKAIIPGILYKDSEQAPTTVAAEPSSAVDDDLEGLEDDLEIMIDEDKVSESGLSDKAESKAAGGTAKKDAKKEDAKKEEEMEEECNSMLTAEVEDEDSDIGASMKAMVEAYLNTLPNCVNRELIDKAAIDFCMNLNTKTNRRKLVRALFLVHRTRYDLLPFYGRLVAMLSPCMPSVSTDLASMLKSDFKWHVRKKDQINIESKLKTVRFIGELVKFNMYSKSEALHCLKMLMTDFTHHNIEMACAFLECCGRFLFRHPESHHRMKVYLDVMMRKKVALHMDSRYSTMIENAFYYSNPPEVKHEAKKELPPMHNYIRRLLYKDLNRMSIEKVLRQVRKLNWDDPEIRSYTMKCFCEIWNVRYSCIHCCANLVAGLASYHEAVTVEIIDDVLEDIRWGMEVNLPKYNQRRISMVRFLGELYNYRMVESQVIFRTLYSFISFGVNMEAEANPSMLDPPEHLFRIRLACILLDTCGQYFDRGSSRKKLDCFLVYFQHYFWFKKKNPIWNEDRPFPMDIEYVFRDSVEYLRPKLKLCQSWEEAVLAVEELNNEFKTKLSEIIKSNVPDAASGNPSSLSTIKESEEQETLTQTTTGTQESEGDVRSDERPEQETQSPSQSQSEKGEDGLDDEDNSNSRMDEHQDADDYGYEDEMIESAGEDLDDDKVTVLTGGPKHIKCQEDDDFMAALDKMMQETYQARTQEVVKIPVVEISVPLTAKTQTKVKPPVLNILPGVSSSPEPTTSARVSESSPPDDYMPLDPGIAFTVLTRKGNKQQLAMLNIPLTATFAAKYQEQKEAEKAEKERMKKVVLDIHERQEEEDYQEMMALLNRPLPSNINRDRRVPYQHPKGAPDADAIFGSKKR